MANPSGGLVHLLPLLLLLLLSCLMSLHHADAALSFTYNFSIPTDLASPDLKNISDCSRVGDRINLTNGLPNSVGRLYHRQPVRLWNGRKQRASFTTSFSFMIGGEKSLNRGDGMAFFIGPSSLPPDSGSMYLGLFANFPNPSSPPPQTVGVEFDTNRNDGTDPPGIADHIGIDINNITSSNYTEVGNVGLYGNLSSNITYDGPSTMMTVTLQLENGTTRTVRALVNFRDAGVPQDANVGFSAATGPGLDLPESHQLLSWSFHSTDPSNSMLVVIWVSVASASLACSVAALLLVIIVRRRRPAIVLIDLQVAKKFSYRELSVATGNFSDDRKLGSGAFGEVYRGELRDPRMPPVAVKRLTRVLDQTRRDYVIEITTLGQLSHRNLIKLVGWCDGRGDDKLLLVYELVTNSSLDKHLHATEETGRLLTWPERYRILLGVSAAIDYLHTGYQNPILHRDIKPSNVMLDEEFEAKLGDFGLVRQVWPEGTKSVSCTPTRDL